MKRDGYMHNSSLDILEHILGIDREGMLDMHDLASYQENTKTTSSLSITN